MDSTMTIMVRVVGRQAIAQLNAVAAGVGGVAAAGSSGAAAKTHGFITGLNGSLVRMGKSAGWVGRQFTYNFTLPLVAAGAALFKANQNITRSMTQVIKVYGDASFGLEAYNRVLAAGGTIAQANAAQQAAAATRVKEETDALATSFELLSTRFGVHQEEVIDIAAAWASAGSAGAGLAHNVRATLEAMILGEMDAVAATEGLIAVQATWGFSTLARAGEVSELTEAMALLNTVENQTGIRFSGLIEVMQRAGGMARTAGMSIRELAAFAAALVPATGSAAQAGNALKTMISRLVSPTSETKDVLREMGIEVDSLAWGSLNATDKILSMADAFNGLDAAAQAQVSSIIASRWQVSRFGVLMADVANEAGYFNKAMAATADQAQANATYQRELLTVLESSPRKWDIMTNAIRNTMAKAFIPLMPAIMSIITMIAKLANAFASLSPDTQKWILLGLSILALVGPVMQLTGAFAGLLGIVGTVVKVVAGYILGPLTSVIKFMTVMIVKGITTMVGAIAASTTPLWVWAAALAAIVVVVIALFNDDLRGAIWEAMKSVGRAFMALPRVVAAAFNAVIRIIGQAIAIIREALSYLNPFARHSPSLVDNVRAGVATILDEYSKFKAIPGMIRGAIAALNAFGAASAPGARDLQQADLQKSQQAIAANDPAAGAAAAAMIPQIMALQDQLGPLAQEIAAQEVLVAQWSAQVDEANEVLEAAQGRLDAVTAEYERVGDAIQNAKDRIDDLANTKLTGMQAMEDQLFAVTMQQNQLNLELVNFERQGYTIDSIRDKYAALNGEIEMLRGEQASLRAAGAGSDVLSVYDDQIAAIESQRESMGGVEQQIIDIQNQLESLDLEQRFLELTKNITFDPLLKQIDELVNGVTEMSFDDVIAGIHEQQALIAQLQPQYDALGAAVAAEEANVVAVTAARDALQASLDEEQRKLDGLNDAYAGIKNLINEMTSAMSEYAQAAQAAADAAAAAGGGGGAGGGGLAEGDFPIAGGGATLGPEGTLEDINAFNEALEAEIQGMLEGMGSMDIFGGVRQAWENFKSWWQGFWTGIKDWFSGLWDSIIGIFSNISVSLSPVIDFFKGIWQSVIDWFTGSFLPAFSDVWDTVTGVIMDAWGWVEDNVIPVIESAVGLILAIWERISPIVLGFLKGLAAGIVAAFYVIKTVISVAMTAIETIIRVVMNGIRIAWGIIWDSISGVVVIIWDFIKAVIEGALLVIKGIFDFFAGLFTGDWDRMWNGILSILEGVWTIIAAVVTTFVELVIQVLETMWRTLVGIFEFAIETLIMIVEGGWNILMTIVKGVVAVIVAIIMGFSSVVIGIFKFMWGAIETGWKVFWGVIEALWNTIKTVGSTIWEGIKTAITSPIETAKALLSGLWDGIKAAAELAWNIIKGVAFTLWEGIKSTIMGPINTVKGLLSGAWDSIKNAAKDAWQAVEDKIKPIVDRIKAIIQGIIDKVKDAIGWLNKIKNFVTNPLGMDPVLGNYTKENIPQNAQGSIVTSRLLTWVAEDGKPEVIIPLTDPARALQLANQSGLFNVLGNALRTGQHAMSSFTNYTSGTTRSEGFSSAGTGSTSSTTVIQINGNLEFPNIKSGDDAKKFVENLKVLAG